MISVLVFFGNDLGNGPCRRISDYNADGRYEKSHPERFQHQALHRERGNGLHDVAHGVPRDTVERGYVAVGKAEKYQHAQRDKTHAEQYGSGRPDQMPGGTTGLGWFHGVIPFQLQKRYTGRPGDRPARTEKLILRL